MDLKVKLLDKDAKLPGYAHPGDAGLDLCSIEDKQIMPGEVSLVKTGISIELPENSEAQIRPRSGLALKYGITLLNSPGTIDEGYRGEIGIIMINHGKNAYLVEKGSRIAQMVVKPVTRVHVVNVNNTSQSTRGAGGFGSTGMK